MKSITSGNIDLSTALGGPPVFAPRWSWKWVRIKLMAAFNWAKRSISTSPALDPAHFTGLHQIDRLSTKPSDINEHLRTMFAEAMSAKPRLIVELGVRSGTSTIVFSQVASVTGATLVSVDLEDCSAVTTLKNWHFVQSDDVAFAAHFPEFCQKLNLAPAVDFLYIDTSHYYQHTKREIHAWFPLLSSNAKVVFHDTNMGIGGPRKDGCYEVSWENQRGVIRAIEDYLGVKLNENSNFTDYVDGWLVQHHANCNGLTILHRIQSN